MIVHLGHLAFARTELLNHYADEFFWNVGGQMLDRLHQLAVDAFGYDLRFPNHQLVTFTAHHFNQD